MTSTEPQRRVYQVDSEAGLRTGSVWAKRFFIEVLASSVFTFAFTVLFIYNLGLGLYDGVTVVNGIPIANQLFLPYMQAFVVGIFAFAVYFVGSRFAGLFVHANPLVSTTYYSYMTAMRRRTHFWLWLAAILGQIVGSGATTWIVYGLGEGRIFDMQQHLIGFDSGNYIALKTVQHVRAWVGELVGVIGLIILVLALVDRYWSAVWQNNDDKPKKAATQSPFLPYALAIAIYYFFYMILFWVHTELSMDGIRAGWFCIAAQASGSDKEPCNPLVSDWPDATLYLFILIAQIAISFIVWVSVDAWVQYRRGRRQARDL